MFTKTRRRATSLDAMNFEIIQKEDFYNILFRDNDFCKNLGKVMLAASMLESNLRSFLKNRNVDKVGEKATLGKLVLLLKKHKLLSKNGQIHFDDLTLKRNYLAHNLFDLFCNNLEETILPSEKLVGLDVEIFQENTNLLIEDLLYFSEIVSDAKSKDIELL